MTPRAAALLLLPVLAILAAGCVASPAKRQVELPVTVPERWSAVETPGGTLEGDWWRNFDDPVLAQLMEEALEKNHDLRAAAIRIEAAAALGRIAGADLYPSVGLSGNRTRAKRNFIGFPIPGAGSGGVVSTTTTTHGVSIDTAWEVDLWGRIRAGAKAALADMQATQADYLGARLSLTGQAAKAWFALVEARQQVDLAERTVETFRTTVGQVRSRFERGLRPSLDLRLALSSLYGAESLLERREIERASVVRQLETLLGRYPDGATADRDTLPALPAPVPAGLPAEIISRRPDLVAAERRLAATDARLVEARRALYPRLTLTASGGRSSAELKDLLNGDFGVWSLVAGLFQPLFEGGRLRANVDLADARTREVLEGYVGTALRAYAEVETALTTDERLVRLEEDLAAASEQAAAARRLAEDRYSAGLDGFLTVLEAQRRDLEAESRLLEVRRQQLDTRVDLYLALGGGLGPMEVELPFQNPEEENPS
jgi:NodT family efflux transporter outer membrane factor (OMF) lipoprotein